MPVLFIFKLSLTALSFETCLSLHSLIKQRKCQIIIIETGSLPEIAIIQQSNGTQSQFCTLHNYGPTRW